MFYTDHLMVILNILKTFNKLFLECHFCICFLQPTSRPIRENEVTYIIKMVFNNNAIELFTQELYKTIRDDVINNKNPNDAYNYFSRKLIVLYDKYFRKQNIRIYKKDLQSPWTTRGIKKSSKLMQNILMQVKFLKNRNRKKNLNIKIIRNFLSRSRNVQKRITFPA